MKTWYQFWPALVFAFILPFVPGLLPTFDLLGQFWGGGPVREFVVNIMVEYLPVATGNNLIERFENGTAVTEFLLYAPVAINISLILMWLVFAFVTMTINVSNIYESAEYESQRKAAKR